MDWNVISAIATVIGTILTFIAILVAIGIEKQKSISVRNRTSKKQSPAPQKSKVVRPTQPTQTRYLRDTTFETFEESDSVSDDDIPHDPYAPYLDISVGLIGACGGVASILVPWLLLQASPELQCLLYPLLITGLVGGVAFALFMDKIYNMDKATPFLRFPLSAICGIIGGWFGLIAIIGIIIYIIATNPPSGTSKAPSSDDNNNKGESVSRRRVEKDYYERNISDRPQNRTLTPKYDRNSWIKKKFDL